MKSGELEYCEANGVKVTEIKLGYDGIVVSSSKDGTLLNISRSNLGQALTAKVPSPDSNFIDNPYKNWSDVNPDLANLPSRVYGPPPRRVHGLHLPRWLTKKVTAKKNEAAKAAGEKDKVCRAMRTDGA